MSGERRGPVLNRLPRNRFGVITDDQQRRLHGLYDARRDLEVELSPVLPTIQVKAPKDRNAFLLGVAGDEHYGTVAAPADSLLDVVGVIRKYPDTAVLLHLSNSMDGSNPKHLASGMNQLALPVAFQVMGVRKILEELDRKGQLIMVDRNHCHEGSAMEQAFLDLIQQVVSPTSPLLGTGGEVHIVDATAERRVLASILAFHNPGGGNNPQSPEAAIRRHLRRIGFANISGAANGHIHVGPIAGEDLTVSRRAEIVNGQRVYPERRVFTIIPGSTKGTTETPDLFLQQKGVALGQMPGNTKNHGGGVIFRHAQGEYRGYPVAGIGPAETMYLAIRAWELAQGKNVLSELMGSLAATGKDIDLTDFDAIPQAEGATHEGHIPMSNDVTYAQTDKPRATALHFIANTRVGAGSFNEDALRAHIADIVRRPHANFIAMRGLVDSVANLPNREEVLLQLRGILGEGASRILGIMMNDVLLDARWQRELRIRRTSDDGERVVEEYPPIYPGDVLVGRENGDQVFGRNPLEGTPLLQSDTDMLVRLGTIDYLLTLRGETSHLKSVINPPHGLARLREVLQIESDVMAGGTPMESIAWRTQHTPTGVFHIVVPGGYSLFDSKGKSNKTLWPLGGQGVVLMSTEKTIFPFGTYADGADLHEAILLYEAIVRSVGKEGYEDFMKNLAGRRKKRAVTKTT